jgi:hypothetical protein
MANDKNSFDISGILYAKDTKFFPNKKKPGENYEFRSIKLEIKTVNGDKLYTDIPEFQLGIGVGFDEYSVGDFINVRFALVGKRVSDTWHKTELRCTFIKYADIQTRVEKSANTPSDFGGMNTNVNKGAVKVDENKVFNSSVPEAKEEDDDFKDLPF